MIMTVHLVLPISKVHTLKCIFRVVEDGKLAHQKIVFNMKLQNVKKTVMICFELNPINRHCTLFLCSQGLVSIQPWLSKE